MVITTVKSFCILEFQLFRCKRHLEIVTEKKHQPTRAFCDAIINLRKQVPCVERKARPTKSLGRSSGEDEAEFCSKFTEVNESCHL
ncbi:hypothetical protein TNCV_1173231 [Trichonephila clavipes]|uniref:Uncharacterized protein n=1 Tax=Trichonephila clavipes TaxID=2585209 RepID=A0A8X6VER0_TRICX|nr:hypothetical protein TNCV_1173231 [Trichonephila clavipes]